MSTPVKNVHFEQTEDPTASFAPPLAPLIWHWDVHTCQGLDCSYLKIRYNMDELSCHGIAETNFSFFALRIVVQITKHNFQFSRVNNLTRNQK
jgi:hypothetical protein